LVEHVARDTRSRQRFQGVADQGGHGVFNGRVVVCPSAQGTDADQQNRNLLLSDRAEIDARPRLEIFGDDVRCAHGATVGRLDEGAVYYLRSRGIPERSARAMLVHAAVDQVVDRLSSAVLRVDVARRVAAAIEPVGITR
jgi:Fe-S cluster assembly protein SufD